MRNIVAHKSCTRQDPGNDVYVDQDLSDGATSDDIPMHAVNSQTVTVGDITVTASGGAKIKHQVIFVLGGPGSGKGTQVSMESLCVPHDSVSPRTP